MRTLETLQKWHDGAPALARAKLNYSQNYEIWSIEAIGFWIGFIAFKVFDGFWLKKIKWKIAGWETVYLTIARPYKRSVPKSFENISVGFQGFWWFSWISIIFRPIEAWGLWAANFRWPEAPGWERVYYIYIYTRVDLSLYRDRVCRNPQVKL